MDEQKKYEVIKMLVDHPQSANKNRAALNLGCTRRHINRMIVGYKKYGKEYFIHGNKGKRPAIALDDDLKAHIVELYQRKYAGANFTHFTELLTENENIHISVSCVTNILESQYILSPKATRAKKKRVKRALKAQQTQAKTKAEKKRIDSNIVAIENAHSRRPRCTYFGELQQMDATPYEWVPGHIWHLHVAIDDATGTITGAWFDTQETLAGYYHVFEQILTNYGIPYKFLTDRRTIFTYKKKTSPTDDQDTYTQFAYTCKQLGVDLCSSSVPQAKGRVERLNQTLQSRLPVEFSLAKIKDIESANKYLAKYVKKFNKQFAHPLSAAQSVFEKSLSKEKINQMLAVLSERTIDSGHCIKFMNKFYKILDRRGKQVHYKKGTKVMVIKAFDGELFVNVNDKDTYVLEEIPVRYEKSKNFDVDYAEPKSKKKYKPPANHPWRHSSFSKFTKTQAHRMEAKQKSA